MDKKIQVAVLACGNRSKSVVYNLLKDSNYNVNIAAVYDPDPQVVEDTLAHWKMTDAKRCSSYQEAINTPGVEWVMVFSPNVYHKEQVVAAFEAGKHVFSEKPLATTIEDCVAINEAHRKSGKLFATGFVLRYAPIYRKAKEILESGVLGDLIAVEANENITPEHGSYIMRNWRRKTAIAGPHILEKCCHDLDLIEWLTNSLPAKVMAFGGRDFFLPKNDELFQYITPKIQGCWLDPHATPSPFTSDGDLMDNLISIAEFRNKVRVSFSCSMSNILPERRMYFSCSKGTMKLDLYAAMLSYATLDDGITYSFDFRTDGHGGGDSHIMKELYETMTTGVLPKCSGSEGLRSAVYAIVLDQAAVSGKIVDVEPIWQELGQ
jgi:predicted dehydrogenase